MERGDLMTIHDGLKHILLKTFITYVSRGYQAWECFPKLRKSSVGLRVTKTLRRNAASAHENYRIGQDLQRSGSIKVDQSPPPRAYFGVSCLNMSCPLQIYIIYVLAMFEIGCLWSLNPIGPFPRPQITRFTQKPWKRVFANSVLYPIEDVNGNRSIAIGRYLIYMYVNDILRGEEDRLSGRSAIYKTLLRISSKNTKTYLLFNIPFAVGCSDA